MSKERKGNKENKKKPTMTQKEKRASKKAKKEEHSNIVDFNKER